jgi:hypothetical protein
MSGHSAKLRQAEPRSVMMAKKVDAASELDAINFLDPNSP